jgi:tetratricopeptide (TPR) repeat protein
MRAAIERHGGRVEKFIGDAVAGVFGLPVTHEDDALRAVRAAVEMQERLASIGGSSEIALACRIGLATGEVLVPSDEEPLIGDVMNTAARLQSAADPGDVVIGELTFQLVRDAVVVDPVEPLTLKGKREPVPAYRVQKVASLSPMRTRRLDAPMIGRARESILLDQAYERATSDRSCQLVTVLGAAGAGKSRLVEEFLAARPGGEVLRGRCLAYGEGITYFPVTEALTDALALVNVDDETAVRAGIAETVRDKQHGESIARNLSGLLTSGEGASPEEIAWATRRFLEARARDQTLVVVFDDIHWGEGTFLDLIAHVAEWSRDASILLLCMARPDLLDVRPSWAGGLTNATTMSLAPLTEGQCDELIGHLLGSAALPEEVRDRIVRVAEGNPLFVEEMLRMLVDEELVVRDGDRWALAVDVSDVHVPPTISALLSARLDRLSDEERAVLERAGVIGRRFEREAVLGLLPGSSRAGIDVQLRSLVRKELIVPDRSRLPGGDIYRFRHLLIRDAAYDAIPKGERAELHERYAEWMLSQVGEDARGFEETVGSHLERATRYLQELDPSGEHGRELASRAAEFLIAAGFRARDRGDEGTSASVLRRADALLPSDDPRRVPSLIAISQCLPDDEAATVDLTEASRVAAVGQDPELSAWTKAELAGRRFMAWGTSSLSSDEVASLTEEAIAVLDASAERRGLAGSLVVRGGIEEWQGHLALANPWYTRALQVASEAHLPADASAARGLLAGTWLLGITPAPEAARRLRELLTGTGGDRYAELELTWRLGVFLARAGDLDGSRPLIDSATRWVEDLGASSVGQNFSWWVATWVDPWHLDPASWEADLRFRFGDPFDPSAPPVAHALAVALCEQGRFDEADRLTSLTTDVARSADVSIACGWRGAHARVLARLGLGEEADQLSSEAVAMAAQTDRLDVQGEVAWHRADVLRALGRNEEADGALRVGIDAFDRKGFGPSADKLRGLLTS